MPADKPATPPVDKSAIRPPGVPPQSAIGNPQSAISNRARILVVDGDVSLLESIQATLGAECEVLTARRGAEAAHVLFQQEVDIVLLDVLLKDCTGLALLPYIKHNYPRTSVVLMTACSSAQVVVLALRGGARDFLLKPFEPRDLLASVGRVMMARELGPRGGPVFMGGLPSSGLDGPGLEEVPLFRALGYIERHYPEPITRDDVAREAGMSRAHFSREFGRSQSIPFVSYLRLFRVARAKELLHDKGVSIGEVALRVGFGTESHFSNVFRDVTGQSPSEYRQEILGAAGRGRKPAGPPPSLGNRRKPSSPQSPRRENP